MKYAHLWQIRYVDPDRRFGFDGFEHKARSLCNFCAEIEEILPNKEKRLKILTDFFQNVANTLDHLNEEHGSKNGLSAIVNLKTPEKDETNKVSCIECKIYDDANIRTAPNLATALLAEISFNL